MPYVTSIERMGREEGREQGREEGRVQALRESVLENLGARFGEVPVAVQEQLLRLADAAKLKALHRVAITCAGLEDFERALQP